MAISYFCYAVFGDSTLDADMIRFVTDPVSMPVWMPYGEQFRAADGQPVFAGAPEITLHWNALTYDTNPNGSALSATTAGWKRWYEDWTRARDSQEQRFTVNILDPITNTWGKHPCVILWADWSGKENGTAFVNFEIVITAIGVAFDTTPPWGETNPLPYSEDSTTQGDALAGAIGYGIIGQGLIGGGAMFGPQTIGYGIIGRGLIGQGSTT